MNHGNVYGLSANSPGANDRQYNYVEAFSPVPSISQARFQKSFEGNMYSDVIVQENKEGILDAPLSSATQAKIADNESVQSFSMLAQGDIDRLSFEQLMSRKRRP